MFGIGYQWDPCWQERETHNLAVRQEDPCQFFWMRLRAPMFGGGYQEDPWPFFPDAFAHTHVWRWMADPTVSAGSNAKPTIWPCARRIPGHFFSIHMYTPMFAGGYQCDLNLLSQPLSHSACFFFPAFAPHQPDLPSDIELSYSMSDLDLSSESFGFLNSPISFPAWGKESDTSTSVGLSFGGPNSPAKSPVETNNHSLLPRKHACETYPRNHSIGSHTSLPVR